MITSSGCSGSLVTFTWWVIIKSRDSLFQSEMSSEIFLKRGRQLKIGWSVSKHQYLINDWVNKYPNAQVRLKNNIFQILSSGGNSKTTDLFSNPHFLNMLKAWVQLFLVASSAFQGIVNSIKSLKFRWVIDKLCNYQCHRARLFLENPIPAFKKTW